MGLPLLVALIHIAAVAPRYHVGSFDDDAAYLLMAHGIVNGVGLGGYLAHHVPLLDAYPPGYPLLLAPLLWLFGAGTYVPERLLSVACMSAVFPLTWIWLRRLRVPEGMRFAVLALLAANPLIATYGTMVMAEAPFLVILGGLLLAGERWESSGRAWCPAAAGTVALAVAAIWCKEAGLAFVPGLVLWLVWRRRWWPAVATGAAGVAGLLPIVIGRLVAGVPIAGARYTSELGGYYSGGMLHRVALVPYGIAQWFFDALPSALVPTGSPLNADTALFVVFRGLACGTTAVLVVIGVVTWLRRRGPDLAFFLTFAYVGEVCCFKFVNERRAILILPILIIWYVIGVVKAYRWLAARVRNLGGLARLRRGFAVCGVLTVAGPLSAQFPADYRYDLGQSSPAPATSPYMALLRDLGRPAQVVETTYLWSTALLSGHATDDLAAIYTSGDCNPDAAREDLQADRASYLLTAAIDTPGQVDSPCLQEVASSASWAVTLFRTPVDDATVFELVGPQTAQPGLHTLLSLRSANLTTPAPPGHHPARQDRPATAGTWRWTLPAHSSVRQVSLGGVAASAGPTGKVTLRLLEGKHWHTLATSPGPVGGGATPFLLATLPRGATASALQLTVDARGPVHLQDLAVLGAPAAPPPPHHTASHPVAPGPTTRHRPLAQPATEAAGSGSLG